MSTVTAPTTAGSPRTIQSKPSRPPRPGVLVYVISALATRHSSKSSPAFIVPVIMCVLLAVQVGAIKVARTKSGTAG